MHFSRGMASCTAGLESALSYMVNEGFGHDGAAGVSCAEDQDLGWFT